MEEYQQIRSKLIELVDTTEKRRINWERLIEIASAQTGIRFDRVRLHFLDLLEAEVFDLDTTPLGGVMINIKNSKHTNKTHRQFIPGASKSVA